MLDWDHLEESEWHDTAENASQLSASVPADIKTGSAFCRFIDEALAAFQYLVIFGYLHVFDWARFLLVCPISAFE